MLAHGLEDTRVSMADYAAEWKWDGIRVQIARVGGETRLYSRAGDDITRSFPEVAESFVSDGVVDGDGRSHDIDNLWVCYNSTFPSALAANPGLTQMALSLRTADRMLAAR